MNTFTVRTIFLLGGLFLFPALLRAEAPAGLYKKQFTVVPQLWDVSGTYSQNSQTSITIVQDDKGKITGQASVSDDSGTTVMIGSVVGSIKTIGGVSRISMTMKLKGTVVTIPATINTQFALDIDPANTELTGTFKTKVCIKARGVGCQSVPGSQQFDLPVDMDGTWDLVMDIQNTSGKLTGTASAVLSNGRSVPLNLNGQYTSSNDLTKLSLKGSAGTVTIQANAVPTALVLQTMTAKLLGQMLAVP